jgi:Icc protein
MVRFIHLTDTHIGPTPHFTLYGRQPLGYLQRAIHAINEIAFDVDFVLHTGDCVDDGAAESYDLFYEAMHRLRLPVKYTAGNHDNPDRLQSIVMSVDHPTPRLDYTFDLKGIKFVVLDTRGPVDPGGRVEPSQVAWLQSHCTPDGPPMVVVMHHTVVPMDTPWLDTQPPGWGGRFMFTENADAVRAAMAPAAKRIRGVFSGHVHGLFSIQRDGIFYSAGQSAFAGLSTLPHHDRVILDRFEPPMINIVTVAEDQVTVRPRVIA